MLLGIALLGAEMIVPGGLFMLFFGIGALIVGLLTALNISGPDWVQWLLFSIASIAMLVLLRSRLVSKLGGMSSPNNVDSMVGEGAAALDEIAPGATGKVELRGSSWNARNNSGVPIKKGQRCKVERVEGLTLYITEDK